jgi:hypothetical protein
MPFSYGFPCPPNSEINLSDMPPYAAQWLKKANKSHPPVRLGS